MNKLIITTLAMLIGLFTIAQNDLNIENLRIELSDFKKNQLEALLLTEVNNRRLQINSEKLNTDSILTLAAEDQSIYMSKNGEANILQAGKIKTTEKRIASHGGSAWGKEFVLKYSVKKGDKAQTYKKIVEDITYKWFKSKRSALFFENPKYIFAGVSINLGEDDRNKIYVSFVLGNYKSLASNADKVTELPIPFSTKSYGLKPYDTKLCKKVDNYKKLSLLQKGLSLEDGEIFFETDDLKRFKKLMRKPKNGIAVDIIQKDQYIYEGANIIDNTTPWKGILLKRVWADKLLKKNLFKGNEAKTKLKIKLGDLPEGLDNKIDLNLIIIQEKHVCNNVMPTYLEPTAIENLNKLGFLADTVRTDSDTDYIPTVEYTQLKFRVPFQKGKFTYDKNDIDPIIKSLQEPEFIIDNIQIDAFSSIEGDINSNIKLQQKRGESIEAALKSFISTNNNISKAQVKTDTNWELFKQDIKNTEFSTIGDLSLAKAQEYIKTKKLKKDLEPILSNHRYAEVRLDISYDIVGAKEEAYVLSRFNKALKENDRIKALSIQKYIFKKILTGEYSKEAAISQDIVENSTNAGLLMNKYWLLKYLDELPTGEDLCEKIHVLYQLDAFNPYLLFNDIYCEVQQSGLSDEKAVEDLRQRIDDLYETNLPESTIDALNLAFNFRVIESVDTSNITPELGLESLKKIKELVDIKEMNEQNALKLSQLFIEHQDYTYSAELLEPFLNKELVHEDLLFTYIGLSTFSDAMISSNRFANALTKAYKANPKRLRKLYKSGRISFQIFDNLKVKDKFYDKLTL